MFPKATKTQMIHFLRDRGYEVANTRQAQFSKYRNSFWLDYEDSNGIWHQAYYSAAAGKPIFSIDHEFINITLDEVINHGMFRKNKKEG